MDEGAATFERRVLRWMRTAKRRMNPAMVDRYPAVSWAKAQRWLLWVDCYSVLAIRWAEPPRGVRVLTDAEEKYLTVPLACTGVPCHRFPLSELARACGAPWEPARCRKRTTHTDQCCRGWGMLPVPDSDALRLRIGGRETVNRAHSPEDRPGLTSRRPFLAAHARALSLVRIVLRARALSALICA